MKQVLGLFAFFLSSILCAQQTQNNPVSYQNHCIKKTTSLKNLSECPQGQFVPLGSNTPPLGVFVSLLPKDHSCKQFINLDFVQKLEYLIHKKDPALPLNIITNQRCIDNLKSKLPSKNINFIGVSGDINRWQQDMHEFGYNAQGHIALLELSKQENYKYSSAIAEQCGFQRMIVAYPFDKLTRHPANFGGNIEAFPGDILVVGNNMHTLLKDFLVRYDNDILPLDTSFLYVGHVDEFINVIPITDSSCHFKILLASPQKLFQLYRKQVQKKPHASSGIQCGQRKCTVSEILAWSPFWQHNAQIEKKITQNYQKLKAKLHEKTQCKKIDVIKLPMVWNKKGLAALPNPINSLILNQHVIVPDTMVDSLNNAIRKSIENTGAAVDFIDDQTYFLEEGDVHCGTNVVRGCR